MALTYGDNTTDPILTEGVHAAGIGEGNHHQCPLTGRDTMYCQCSQRQRHLPGCECLPCSTRRYWQLAHRAADSDHPELYTAPLERLQRYIDEATEHEVAAEELRAKQAAHAAAKAKLHKGAWAFTLTYSPAQTGWDKEEAKATMREAIRRLRHYYRHEIEEFDAVGELTQAGLPHIHGHYRLTGGKRITTKNFKRAYPIWDPKSRIGNGHVGGYHQPAKSDSDYSGYIQKDLDDAWLVESTTNAVQTSGPEARDEVQAPDDDTPPDSPNPPA